MMRRTGAHAGRRAAIVGAALLLAGAGSADARPRAADLVLRHARIHTADRARAEASALAVRGGRFVYVGDDRGAARLIGAHTRVIDAHGARVLPGLIDAHIHPVSTLDAEVCDVHSRALSLAELADVVRRCIARGVVRKGQWLDVAQWNYYEGNQPDPRHATLRAALDAAAPDNPVQLLGSDGHHAAFNSRALAEARDPQTGARIGLDAATVRGPFARYASEISLDAQGAPDGWVNDEAAQLVARADDAPSSVTLAVADPARVVAHLNASGITAVQDADVTEDLVAFYDALVRRHVAGLRVNLALDFIDWTRTPRLRGDGSVDLDAVLAEATRLRARFAASRFVRADAVKIFVDGGMEGDPRAVPPTPPNSPWAGPYLQPLFATDATGTVHWRGYADLDGPACSAVRADPQAYADDAAKAAFRAAQGYLPAQCAKVSGRFRHDPAVVKGYATALHRAGFTLHFHAESPLANALAVDAIAAARAADGKSDRPDTIAHVQLVDPADVARFGQQRIYVAATFSWAYANRGYDLSVVPWVERVRGDTLADLHDPDGYYERNAYPFRALRDAGAILVGASDAPVDTKDPQPFVNIERAVTRAFGNERALSPGQALRVGDAVDAYTINAAAALGRTAEIGSITPGKSADFIVIDQDIFVIAPGRIGKTAVCATWFAGRRVFSGCHRPRTEHP